MPAPLYVQSLDGMGAIVSWRNGWISIRIPWPKGAGNCCAPTTKQKVTAAEMAAVALVRHTVLLKWNYTISPRTA